MVGGHSWNKGWSREGTDGIRGGLGGTAGIRGGLGGHIWNKGWLGGTAGIRGGLGRAQME